MSATDVRAGRAYVEITSKDAALEKGLARARAKLRAFAAGVSDIGQSLLRATAAPLAAVGFSTRVYMGFSDQMREAQAVTGATAAEYANLNAQAKELGRTTSWTAQQVAQGMTELGRAGFKPSEIENAIQAVLNLGRATRTELATAAEIAGTTMRGFALDASQATRVADVLAATANISATDVVHLGEAFKYLAPQAVEAGETLEDTAAALAVLANNGITGTLAGNALARAYKNLSTDTAQKQLAEINVEAVDANGNLRKLADVLTDVGRATAGMGTARRLAIFEGLFGRGQAAALKLAGGSAFGDMRKQLEGIAGTAARTAQTMDDDLGGAWRRMASAAEGVQIAIGEAVSGTLARYMEAVTASAGRMVEWVERHQAAVVSATVLIGKVALLGAGMIALAGAFKLAAMGVTAMMATTKLVTAITAATVAVATYVRNVVLVGQVLGVAAAKTYALNSAVMASRAAWAGFLALPIGAVAMGIAAALVGVAYALDRAKRYTAETSTAMQEAAAKGETLRRTDELRMQRLEQLSRKARLNNDEQREALDLVSQLRDRYGNLGLSIDRATGAIEGMAQAQKALNAAMRAREFDQLKSEYGELSRNVQERNKEMQSRASGSAWSFLPDWITGSGRAAIESLTEQNLKDLERMRELRGRLQALSAGERPPAGAARPSLETSVAQGADASAEAARQAGDIEKRLASIREQVARERRSAVENEIADVRKLGAEYAALLQGIIATEEGKRDADAGRIRALKSELAGVSSVINELLGQIQSREERAITETIARQRREIDATGFDISEMFAETAERRAQGVESAQINKLIQEAPAKAVEQLSSMMAVAAANEEKAKAALTSLWNSVKHDSKITEDERRLLDVTMGDYRALADRSDSIRGMLEGAQDAVEQAADQFDVRGTFVGRVASMIGFGDTTAADKTADATQKTADNTRRILERIEDGTLVFA